MEILFGTPFRGQWLARVKKFLRDSGLDYDGGVEFTIAVTEDDRILATGSRQGAVLKCIAVASEERGTGYASIVLTNLIKNAADEKIFHLFLYTKAENKNIIGNLGFYPVAETKDAVLMENVRSGVRDFVAGLECPVKTGKIGCIVANANPFTLGHLFLVEAAARFCRLVHLFILSEERSIFPANVRLMLARQAVAPMSNVVVHPTGQYMVSGATFPNYFIRDKAKVPQISGELDLAVFLQQFVGPLGITHRFVGSEPLSPLTESYNRAMKRLLPVNGVEVVVVPRMQKGGETVSASRVRELLNEGNLDAVQALVPESTYRYLKGQLICKAESTFHP